VYATWSNQIKAFIIACPLEPGHLTESPVDSIIWFARGQLPVKLCIELIKHEHQPTTFGNSSHSASEDDGERCGQEGGVVQ